jgi:beta-glucanase (GH16 family)
MKIFFQILLCFLLLSSLTFPQGYKLIWSDEFDSTSLDPSIWSFETGNNGGWGNNELEYYTNRTQNCNVQNGMLNFTAVKESYSGYNYTSARILTQNKFSVKFGKIEARIKLPYGQGIWPAFWMLGDDINQVSWPGCGEIDIMELIGGQGRDNTVYGSAHWGSDYSKSYSLSSGIFFNDFHIFDITWDQKSIVWHVDGITYNTLDITPSALSAFQKSFFIIFNLAVGGNWPGNPDNTSVFPQTMQVDYVRVYQDTSSLPSVSIITPQNNSAFAANTNIILTANASIPNGSISKVDFYQDAVKIGETFVSPYQISWNNVLAGNYRITAVAYSNNGSNTTSGIINVNIGSNAVTSPYGGTPAPVPGTIEAENFDLGGQNNAYYDSDTPNDGGQYRLSEGVDIETCTDVGGGYDVGWTANNEWMKYTIAVKDSGTYQISARVSSNSTTGSMHFEIDGNDVTGTINVPNTGGWQTWSSVLSKNFILTSGIHQIKFFINTSGFNVNKFDIYPPNAKPSINFIYPEGGEQFSPDSIVEVKWNSLQVGTVNIGLSTNGGTFWSSVQNGVDAGFGVYRWIVPKVISANCKLIIMDKDNTSLFDTSKAVFSVGTINSVGNNSETSKSFSLGQNYPNPFNPSTIINYHAPGSDLVNISVYNLLGKTINTLVNEVKTPGEYRTVWNGKDINGNDVPSGIYFYSIRAGNLVQVKKMVLLK